MSFTIQIGQHTLSDAEAIALYNRLRHGPLDDAVSSEVVALWNLIQAADKRSKGIPLTKLPFNPKTEAALERLVARLQGATL
jgi:hypothetical protein